MSFRERLRSGEFVVLAEMDTPKGVDISELVTNARKIKGSVDAVVIPDLERDVMRMSALGAGALMRQQGLEPIINICCRDRNRIALQAELLSAHVLGIHAVVVAGGGDMSYGDHPDAVPVQDLGEEELLGAIRKLEQGVDLAGLELKGSPSFIAGSMIGPSVDDKGLETELKKAKDKVEAGAAFFISPAVFDLKYFESFMERAGSLGVPIIPTVFLLKSVGIARYIAVNEPGAHLSEETIRRIRKAPDRVRECIRIAGETVNALRGLSQGVVIQTLGWEHRLPAILEEAGLA